MGDLKPELTLKPKSLEDLARLALECRKDILTMITEAGSGHPGGSLSAIDIITYLFFNEIRMDIRNPHWEERDRFVLSKGHGVPALYSVLSRKGVLPQEELLSLRKLGSRLQGHPDRILFPFVEASTGSLGQGLSVAIGMAMGLKLARKSARVFCLLGDGELQEGQVWEAAMAAPRYHLGNLIAIVDSNKGQIDGHTYEVMDLEPLGDKWRAFNWTVHIIDGHSFSELRGVFEKIGNQVPQGPQLILANTIKGKGVSFMEGNIGWHGMAPTRNQLSDALRELENSHPR